MRRWLFLSVAVLTLVAGCRAGTAPQELEQLRARVSTLEAENAHLQGQVSIMESERDQLREQVNTLATDLAKAEAGTGAGEVEDVAASKHLVVIPREVRPGEWIAVHVRNYPVRLLPEAGLAIRGGDETNLVHLPKLASANVFTLAVPKNLKPGTYRVVLGAAGALTPGTKLDDQVAIAVR